MKTRQQQISLLLAWILLLQPAAAGAGDDKHTPWLQSKILGRRPKAPETSVQKLARAMDWLEEELLEDGSVVAKAPDVWGEARLTAHRAEFEKQMAAQVDQFQVRINASVSRSDQAFLASAVALSNTAIPTGGNSSTPFTQVNQMLPGIVPVTTSSDTPSPSQSGPNTMTIFNSAPGQLFAGQSPFGTGYEKVQLEQTIELDQRARYLNHLHELRRLNEGDDTADSPGYSLNLVRIPISILPGSKTRRGHSAEITVTAEPVITDELLPSTFRTLVINDLVDQLTVPIVADFALKDRIRVAFNTAQVLMRLADPQMEFTEVQFMQMATGEAVSLSITTCIKDAAATADALNTIIASPDVDGLQELFPAPITESNASEAITNAMNKLVHRCKRIISAPKAPSRIAQVSGHRRARSPLSGEALYELLDSDIDKLIIEVRKFVRADSLGVASAVRNLLRDELENAWETVFDPMHASSLAALDLNQVERSLATGTNVGAQRSCFNSFRDKWQIDGELRKLLCWPVLVESLLLNRQLNADIRHVSQDPACQCLTTGSDLVFYGMNPDLTARMAFVQYVKCRWPIHVFALDPVAQDQNVTDQYAMRRELQLAMALALSSGRINAQTATRFARRLEMDMETVALNRTAVAFGHGRDTFGWRFSPRVQTPEFESNGKVLFRDLLLGGPNRDELKKQWQLEPGVRECFAVVLMPSFITHVRFDSRGHFSPLVCDHLGTKTPADTRSSITDTVELSRMIREMQDFAVCAQNESHLYRDGEVQRLMKRVEQLSGRLPLQTSYSRVPNENTLGGFEMFSSGVTDLAPELYDWFGEPGVSRGKDTKVFLIGSNFSVTGTRVIAGNQLVEHVLLSREVMEIRIPAAALSTSVDAASELDIHVATPYGVSQHLHIPFEFEKDEKPPAPAAPPRLSWGVSSQKAIYRWNVTGTEPAKSWTVEADAILAFEPHEIAVQLPAEFRSSVPIPSDATLNLAIYHPNGDGKVALLANSTAGLKYAPDRHAFVMEGAAWLTLQGELRTKLVGRLKSLGYANNPPPEFTLHVTGFITPTGSANPRVEIAGSIQHQAFFQHVGQ